MNTGEQLNIAALELPPSKSTVAASIAARAPRIKIDEPFVKGPLPVRWFKDAHMAGKAAHSVALVLWYYLGLKGCHFEINLTRLKLLWGISRQSAGRGLRELQAAGLIEVQRKPGSKSKITMFKTALKQKVPR